MKYNILIVDDDEGFLNTLRSELQAAGHAVTSTLSGAEAIALLSAKSFDIMLLDIVMPTVDGFEVLKFSKDTLPKLPVIIITKFGSLKYAIEVKKLGAEDFIVKPYVLQNLLTTIERVLSTE